MDHMTTRIAQIIRHRMRTEDVEYLLCGPVHRDLTALSTVEFLTTRRAFIDLVEKIMVSKEDIKYGRQLFARTSGDAGKTEGGRC